MGGLVEEVTGGSGFREFLHLPERLYRGTTFASVCAAED
jgi:hypothetical protein